MNRRFAATGAALVLFLCGTAFGQSLPREMSWTAYDTGSSGFNTAVAIAQQFKNAVDSDVRILPAGNDTGRLTSLKANRALISQMGIGTYFAQEGVFEFGARNWGPQPARLVMSATACNGISLVVAKDLGAKEIKDLKGKRVGVVVGSPGLTQGAIALIAFGNLTEQDVTLVQFSSTNAMWKGLIDNETDALLASTVSSRTQEAANAPRGIMWPSLPIDDKAGWARVLKKAPYFAPQKATCGAGGLSPDASINMASYAYPIFMTYADRPTDTIFAITRAMIDTYDKYKDSAPEAAGMALTRQNLTWVVPYHEGTIRAFKERGIWTDVAQAHNDALVKRQQVMLDAWKTYSADAPSDDKAFADGWLKARAAALTQAGMDVVFE